MICHARDIFKIISNYISITNFDITQKLIIWDNTHTKGIVYMIGLDMTLMMALSFWLLATGCGALGKKQCLVNEVVSSYTLRIIIVNYA